MSEIKALAVIQPEELISQAVNKGVPVETMERLLAMRTQIKQEQAKEMFYISLAKFQSEVTAVPKSKEVNFPSKSGGSVKYSYAPIEVIVDHVKSGLRDNGFSYTLKTEQTDKNITVSCEAHHEAGHTEVTSLTVPMSVSDKMNVIQQIGAAITYAKRYAFCNAFGIMTADEDTDAVEDVKKDEKIIKVEPPELKALKELVTDYYKTKGGGTDKKIWLEALTEEVIKIKTADLSSLSIEQMATLSAAIKGVKNDNNKQV